MPKHTKQEIAGLFHLLVEEINRLRDGLIDRFVKPDHVIQVGDFGAVTVHPQTQDTRAQRAVFGCKLIDAETASRAQ